MVRDGLFREDLFYRLSAVALRMPALREHAADIPEIARELWERGQREVWRTLNRPQVEALTGYDYPGNVRELANLLDRAYALDERDFNRLLKGYREVMSDGGTSPTAVPSGRSERLEDITACTSAKCWISMAATSPAPPPRSTSPATPSSNTRAEIKRHHALDRLLREEGRFHSGSRLA